MYLFTIFSFIILLEFLLYELNKKCRNHLRDFFLINIKVTWATANTTKHTWERHSGPVTNKRSIYQYIPVWKLFIDFLHICHYFVTYAWELCFFWSNWSKTTHIGSYFATPPFRGSVKGWIPGRSIQWHLYIC